jgi:hypothetical protein
MAAMYIRSKHVSMERNRTVNRGGDMQVESLGMH